MTRIVVVVVVVFFFVVVFSEKRNIPVLSNTKQICLQYPVPYNKKEKKSKWPQFGQISSLYSSK